MLSNIKKMINEKTDFMEAADFLMEEAAGNLDDLIVLGEEAEEIEEEVDDEEVISGPDNIEESEEDEVNEEEEETVEDIMNSKIKDDPNSTLEDDIPEDPLPLPGDQTPQQTTGNIMDSEIEDDILSTNIDLRSNTARDTLPIPPGSAGDAIEGNDDMMTQRVDSGFGGEPDSMNTEIPEEGDTINEEIPEGDDGISESVDEEKIRKKIREYCLSGKYAKSSALQKLDEEFIDYWYNELLKDCKMEGIESPTKKQFKDMMKELKKRIAYSKKAEKRMREKFKDSPIYKESYGKILDEVFERCGTYEYLDYLSEAITVAGDEGNDADTGSDTSTDNSSDSSENDVTSAVMDKVAESDTPDEGMGEDLDTDLGGEGSSDTEANIMKKLSKLTKDIEDAKNLVINSMSKK